MTAHQWNPYLRYPAGSLIVTALLLVPLLWKLDSFRITSEMRVVLEGDQRNLASYEKVREILADVEVAVISLQCKEVFSPEGLRAVRRVSEAFEAQPGVVDVKSLTHSSKPVRRGFTFEMVPFVPRGEVDQKTLDDLKEYSLAHPLVRDVMVAGDSRHTLITVTYRREFRNPEEREKLRDEIQAILAPFRLEGLGFQVLALPLIEEEILATLLSDIWVFVPVVFAILGGILWWTFRSGWLAALVVGNELVVLLLLPGLIAASGFTLNVFSAMVFPLLGGIHLTLLAHLYTAFQRACEKSATAEAAIESMLAMVFKSCLFAAATTLVGLMALTVSDVRQVREFGALGALGLGLIFFMSFGPGLAVLKLLTRCGRYDRLRLETPWASGGLRIFSDEWFHRVLQLARGRRKMIVGAAVAGFVLTAWGLSLIRTDIRAVEFLNRKSPTRQAVEELDRVYGGINVVQIDMDAGVENGINQLPFLKYMEQVQEYAQSRPSVSGAYSYAQLMAMINQIWEGDRPEALKLPDQPLLLNLFVLALKAQNFPFLTALADPTFRSAYLVVRTQDMPSDQYLAIIQDILEFAQWSKPEQVTISAARGIHTILEADRRILRSQRDTVIITVLIIGGVLALLWRSPGLALLALITNAIPVAFVVALAGFFQIPLNSITIMVAAIALAIAVDDSIHFLTFWREERHRGASRIDALQRTLQVKGRPIVFTSLILIAIFSVFWLSSFPPVVHFGLLSACAFIGALAAVLLFLPALLAGK